PADYTGMTGACTTTGHLCTFTPVGPTSVTITASRDSHEVLSLFGGDLVEAFAIDGRGDIIEATFGFGNTLRKVDATGAILWAVPLPARGNRHVAAGGPGDHIALWNGTELAYFTTDGEPVWSITLPHAAPDTGDLHPLAIAPDGDIAVSMFDE